MKRFPLALAFTALLSFPVFAEYTPVTLLDSNTVVESINGRFSVRRFNEFLVERWFGHNRVEAMIVQANTNLTRVDQLITALNELKGEPIAQNEKYEALVAKVTGIQSGLQAVVDAPMSNRNRRKELSRFYKQARNDIFEVVRDSVSLFEELVDYGRTAMIQETNRLQRKIPDHLEVRDANGVSSQVTLAEGLRRILQNSEDLARIAQEMRAQLNELSAAFTRVEEAQARMEAQIGEGFTRVQQGQERILTEIESVLAQQAEERAANEARFERVFTTLDQVVAKLDTILTEVQAVRLEILSTLLKKYHYVRMDQVQLNGGEQARLTDFLREIEDGVHELESRGYQVALEISVRSKNDVVGSANANTRVAAQRVARVTAALRSGIRSDILARTSITTPTDFDQSDAHRMVDRGAEIKVKWVLTAPAR